MHSLWSAPWAKFDMTFHMDTKLQDYCLRGTSHQCNLCPADIHNYPYNDVSEAAAWMGHEFTEVEFRAAHPDMCDIFLAPGVSHLALAADTMHNKHLGMDQYYLASVLYLLVFVMLPGMPTNFIDPTTKLV